MAFCSKCGAQIYDGAQFCPKCGQPNNAASRQHFNQQQYGVQPKEEHSRTYKMWHSKWFSYAQCWSKHRETDAMWRCYSYGNRAIKIKTSDEKLLAHIRKIFPDPKVFSVHLKKVSYDLNKKFEEAIK